MKTTLLIPCIILFLTIGIVQLNAQIEQDYCRDILTRFDSSLNKIILKTKMFSAVEFFPLKNTPDNLYQTPNLDIGVTKIEKSHFLNLKIKFQKNNMSNYPGYLIDKAQIVLHYILGGNIVLLNINECIGKRDQNGYLIYEPLFFIPREDLKHMSRADIDYISINWTNGADTYEVYQVDVLRRLLSCFENN